MKSYIYIVITKELFRRSIAGDRRGQRAAARPPLSPWSPRSRTLWDYVPAPAAGGPGAAGPSCFVLVQGWGQPRSWILALVLPLVAQAHHGDGAQGLILQRFLARNGEQGCPLSCCSPSQCYMKGLSPHHPIINAPPLLSSSGRASPVPLSEAWAKIVLLPRDGLSTESGTS